MLQLLGTEWGRKTRGEDIWVNAALADVDKFTMKVNTAGKKPVFVFDDCRFHNEIFAWGGEAFRVRLYAPEECRKERAEKWREATDHPSEIGLDEVTDTYFNVVVNTTQDKDNVRAMLVDEVVRFCHCTIGLP